MAYKIIRWETDMYQVGEEITAVLDAAADLDALGTTWAPGSVAIVALDEDMGLLLVEQYRYAIGRMLLEIPAGKLAPGETPEEAAGRELQEETGAQPGSLLSLGKIYAAPGCYSEALYLFLARGLRFGQTQPDEDEFLLQRRVPFQQAVEMVLSGEIEDGKTVSAVLKARYLLGL